jgi:hypothetical protein
MAFPPSPWSQMNLMTNLCSRPSIDPPWRTVVNLQNYDSFFDEQIMGNRKTIFRWILNVCCLSR